MLRGTFTRRGALSAAAGVVGAGVAARLGEAAPPPHHEHAGIPDAMVDPDVNGFDPTRILRDFDWGKTRRLAGGRTLREWELVASDKEIEIVPGVKYTAWEFTYEFEARPFGLHLYHCHALPLAEHIAKGLYGAFIVDPPQGRPPADELIMVQNAFDPNFDEDNEVYAVNTVAFHFMHNPVRVRRDQLVRIYLVNIVELDPINSFHVPATSSTASRPGPRSRRRNTPIPSSRARVNATCSSFASRTPAGTCSTRTRASSQPSAGWGSSRSSNEGGVGRDRTGPSRRRLPR